MNTRNCGFCAACARDDFSNCTTRASTASAITDEQIWEVRAQQEGSNPDPIAFARAVLALAAPTAQPTGQAYSKRLTAEENAILQAAIWDSAEIVHPRPVAAVEPSQPVAAERKSMRTELQEKCSAWGSYWRASDSHGVVLTKPQVIELLQDAIGVEVEISDNGCETCDGTGMIGDVPCPDCASRTPAPAAPEDAKDAARYREFFNAGLPITFLGEEFHSKSDLDAAIDAAIASTTKASGGTT